MSPELEARKMADIASAARPAVTTRTRMSADPTRSGSGRGGRGRDNGMVNTSGKRQLIAGGERRIGRTAVLRDDRPLPRAVHCRIAWLDPLVVRHTGRNVG